MQNPTAVKISGTGLLVTPINKNFVPFYIYGDVEYSDEYGIYYCNGQSFPADIAELLEEAEVKAAS